MRFLQAVLLAAMIITPCIQKSLHASEMILKDPDEIFADPDFDMDPVTPAPGKEPAEHRGEAHFSLLPDHWWLKTSTAYADHMLDFDENLTSKALDQLRFRRENIIETGKLYVSGIFKGSYTGEWTNTENAFPILTRFPDHAAGTESHDFFIDNAAFALTATPTSWLTLFAQLEYHENRFATQDPWQFRKAYATVGDLNRLPLYLTVGRKTIPFGDFDIYTPFTQNINNHFFRAESDDPIIELGYTSERLNLTATAISGGRHLRTADTANDGKIDNFAIDGDITLPFWGGTLKVGGGYLRGSIYNHTLPHHPGPEIDCPVAPGAQGVPKCRGLNAAYDLRAEYSNPYFDLMAEFTSTVDPWPATGQKLKAWTVQGRYKTEFFNRKTHLSLSYSRSDIGPFSTGGPGAPVFDEIEQIIVGAEVFLHPNFSLGIEYSHNTGFAPLINILDTAKDAKSDQLIIGGRLVF